MKSHLLLVFLLQSCVTSSDNSSALVSSEGCCQGFLSNPQTPLWYKDMQETAKGEARILCESGDGKWQNGPCDTSDIIGGCEFSDLPLPYVQLFPENAFAGQDEREISEYYCPVAPGHKWISSF